MMTLIFINPLARYPCPIGYLLKLLCAIHCLHQAPVKFKQEVIDWLKANGYNGTLQLMMQNNLD